MPSRRQLRPGDGWAATFRVWPVVSGRNGGVGTGFAATDKANPGLLRPRDPRATRSDLLAGGIARGEIPSARAAKLLASTLTLPELWSLRATDLLEQDLRLHAYLDLARHLRVRYVPAGTPITYEEFPPRSTA